MTPSKREYQIAELIAWGASDKEVAMELNISTETARTHRRNVEHKIGARNAADLTRWFFTQKCKCGFGCSPRVIKHLAMAFLVLVLYAECLNVPIVRIKASRVRSQQTQVSPVRVRSKRNQLVLA